MAWKGKGGWRENWGEQEWAWRGGGRNVSQGKEGKGKGLNFAPPQEWEEWSPGWQEEEAVWWNAGDSNASRLQERQEEEAAWWNKGGSNASWEPSWLVRERRQQEEEERREAEEAEAEWRHREQERLQADIQRLEEAREELLEAERSAVARRQAAADAQEAERSRRPVVSGVEELRRVFRRTASRSRPRGGKGGRKGRDCKEESEEETQGDRNASSSNWQRWTWKSSFMSKTKRIAIRLRWQEAIDEGSVHPNMGFQQYVEDVWEPLQQRRHEAAMSRKAEQEEEELRAAGRGTGSGLRRPQEPQRPQQEQQQPAAQAQEQQQQQPAAPAQQQQQRRPQQILLAQPVAAERSQQPVTPDSSSDELPVKQVGAAKKAAERSQNSSLNKRAELLALRWLCESPHVDEELLFKMAMANVVAKEAGRSQQVNQSLPPHLARVMPHWARIKDLSGEAVELVLWHLHPEAKTNSVLAKEWAWAWRQNAHTEAGMSRMAAEPKFKKFKPEQFTDDQDALEADKTSVGYKFRNRKQQDEFWQQAAERYKQAQSGSASSSAAPGAAVGAEQEAGMSRQAAVKAEKEKTEEEQQKAQAEAEWKRLEAEAKAELAAKEKAEAAERAAEEAEAEAAHQADLKRIAAEVEAEELRELLEAKTVRQQEAANASAATAVKKEAEQEGTRRRRSRSLGTEGTSRQQ